MRFRFFPLFAGLVLPASLPAAGTPAAIQALAYPGDAAADAWPVPRLRGGSLIESIAFSCAYLRAAPAEDCIVLTSPPGAPITGLAVYTQGDRLFLRSPTAGTRPLPGLAAADINHLDRIRPAVAAALARAGSSGGPAAAEADESQLRKAAAAVAFFPSTIAEVTLAVEDHDGSIRRQKTRVLVLDWNQRHYLWNPTVGTIEVPVPIDPLTRTPYLCVRQPELPGSVLFAREYVRERPAEKAEVLLDPVMSGRPLTWFPRGVAVAAYTEGAQVGLHTPYGNIALEDATRADFADLPRLTAKAFDRYHHFLVTHREATAIAPSGLIGDTDELQWRRAHFRLQVAQARPGRIRGGREALIIACGSLQYVYAPGHGAAYSGWLPPYLPLLVDGILFAEREAQAHPEEKFLVLAHPPSSRLTYPAGGVNAHVFYTRGKALWGHITEDHVGEYRVDAAAEAFADRPRMTELCYHNPALTAALARAGSVFLGGDYHRPAQDLPPEDRRPFDPEVLRDQLQELHVPCRGVRERERMEDGHIREYPGIALAFRWADTWFVYADQKVFRARARGYEPDLGSHGHAL